VKKPVSLRVMVMYFRVQKSGKDENVTLAQTRLPDGGQAWIAKYAYIDLACEILQRPHYVPTMSRAEKKTGIETVICLRQLEGIILTFGIWI